MKLSLSNIVPCIVILAFSLVFVMCEGPNHPFYNDETDPNPTGDSPAEIDRITPPSGFLGQELTIIGRGFDPVPENNMVVFKNKPAEIISAEAEELTVIAPDIVDDTVKVKVAVRGSEYWSDEVEFIFWDVVTVLSDEIAEPTGVVGDDDMNFYVGSKIDQTVYRIASDGSISTFVDDISVNGAVKFGAGNYLYAATTDGISRISQDGNTVELVVELSNVLDFDWDQNGNLYALVANGVHRLDTDENLEQMTSNNGAVGLRVYDNHVYVTEQFFARVQRYEITENELEYKDMPFRYTSAITGIEIDENGKLYIGVWFREYLIAALNIDDYEYLFEENELPTNILRLNYYDNTILAVKSGNPGKVLRLYTGVEGAPKYGR